MHLPPKDIAAGFAVTSTVIVLVAVVAYAYRRAASTKAQPEPGVTTAATAEPTSSGTPIPAPSASGPPKERIADFVAYVAANKADPSATHELGEAECLGPTAQLTGGHDPEAGFCAKLGNVGPLRIYLDYLQTSPRVASFHLMHPKGTPGVLNCAGINGAVVKRRWIWGGKNTWCSIESGPLRGWQARVKVAQLGTDHIWLMSPEWMKHGGTYENAWKTLKTQGD